MCTLSPPSVGLLVDSEKKSIGLLVARYFLAPRNNKRIYINRFIFKTPLRRYDIDILVKDNTVERIVCILFSYQNTPINYFRTERVRYHNMPRAILSHKL
jgi:hypothetical protein